LNPRTDSGVGACDWDWRGAAGEKAAGEGAAGEGAAGAGGEAAGTGAAKATTRADIRASRNKVLSTGLLLGELWEHCGSTSGSL
jgi:hypothetical protein